MAYEWIVDVKKAPNLSQRSAEVSIYNVPEFLVRLNPSAYLPQRVGLGLFHHAKHPEMHNDKLCAMQQMFDMAEEKLEKEVLEPILDLAPTVRKCYEQNTEYQDCYLARMLTLDACFILEILRALDTRRTSDQCVFDRSTVVYKEKHIMSDILMLENQIPLFVLLKILGLELKIDEARAFTELCKLLDCAYVERLFNPLKETAPWLQKGIPPAQECKHLLDLFRMLAIASSEPHQYTVKPSADYLKQEIMIPAASELRRAGLKFRKMEGNLTAIRIRKNEFYLPTIRIYNSSETLLRNLMAYELCEAKETCPMSSYVLLMRDLIDSENDVHVLKEAGIIKSYTASDWEVADLFDRLAVGITRSYKDPFAQVREDAHKQYRRKFKVIVAEFCPKPWTTLSALAACMILLLTALQSIFVIDSKY